MSKISAEFERVFAEFAYQIGAICALAFILLQWIWKLFSKKEDLILPSSLFILEGILSAFSFRIFYSLLVRVSLVERVRLLMP